MVTKKGEKIHPPDKIRKILFDRPHLENEEGYKRPKLFLLDPRPLHDRETTIDWNQLSVASEGNASVLCFKNFNDSFVDHNYQPSLVTQDLQPLTVRNIASESQNINMFYSILFKNRTKDFITDIRKLTFGQSSNNLWFDYRYGVITASVAHDVLLKCSRLRTSSVNSLVARILQYSKPVRAASLAWGVENESFARKRYIRQNRRTHKHFQCKESGLMLHLKKPMFGASVDGYVSCLCCGSGCLEIKCPFTHREKSIREYVEQPNYFIIKGPDDTLILKPNHAYYSQVQHQMFVTGFSYTDFVVFLRKDSCIIRIKKDDDYELKSVPLTNSCCQKFLPFSLQKLVKANPLRQMF